jgi:hypothetical protein
LRPATNHGFSTSPQTIRRVEELLSELTTSDDQG